MKMSEITYKRWTEKYLPMSNYITNEGWSYETYGDELEYVKLQDENHVWTEVEGDDGTYIVNGMATVNRLNYYITNKPWNDGEFISIPISKDVICSCYDVKDIESEPDEDCEMCYGTGTYTEWID